MNYIRVKNICCIKYIVTLLCSLVLLELTLKRCTSSPECIVDLTNTDDSQNLMKIHANTATTVNTDFTSPLLALQNTINLLHKEYQLRLVQSKTTMVQKGEYKRPYCGEERPFLLIEVHSTPESFTAREAIRVTWGRKDNHINKINSTR